MFKNRSTTFGVGALLMLTGSLLPASVFSTSGFFAHGYIDWSKLPAHATSAVLPIVGEQGVTATVKFSNSIGKVSYTVSSPLRLILSRGTSVDISFSNAVQGVDATVSKSLVPQTVFGISLMAEGIFDQVSPNSRQVDVQGTSETPDNLEEQLTLVADSKSISHVVVSESSDNEIANNYPGYSIESLQVM